MILGYARVSEADEQDTRMQETALRAAGAERVFAEQASGGRWERPALHRMLDQLRPDDVVVVWKLDRLSRSLKDLLHILFTTCQCTLAMAPTRSDARHRHRQTLAAADTRDGGGADRSHVDLARGPAVPRAAVAAARGGVSKQWWWAAARGGGLSRRRASTRPASRTSTEGRGPLGGRERPLI